MEVVTAGQLGKLGPLIGKGGQAHVYAAPGIQLPDAPGPLVYKQYNPGHSPAQGLRGLVRFRNNLDRDHRDRLDRCAAWPVRVVEDGGRVHGVLMRLIPASFMHTRILPGTGTRQTGPREVQNLMVPPERAGRVGMPVPEPQERLGLCRDLAAALHLLHRNNLVYGDLNARNEVFRLGEHPTVMLVDCDAIRKSGSAAVVQQLNAPDWEAPERWLTMYTDRYKFGLFVLRCFATGEQISTTRDPRRADAQLDADGRRLLRLALDDDRDRRPTMQEWGWYLQGRLTGRPVATGGTPAPVPAQRTAGSATTGWIRDKGTGKWVRR
ncbi:hypothetical protein GCM10010399_79080 [Dactylosporangium fulvum]|uniref:Protein kinase domain-containing protein n=1 Tax=Dactylosporangium fulvum TaxID=53359 RepID=A0ABY5W1G3_9ACTN|nr:hypothetical protein [Dactylosporangium fulvum]UWP83225.1 hypothetical protein Dfulv_02645 [Dactylosporangium fulvum]